MCVNNQWAISTPRRIQTAAESIAAKSHAAGIAGIQIDGNDLDAVYETTVEARRRALAGEGPTLIEAVTYRLAGHTTADDPSRYVQPEELEEWKSKEPVLRLREILKAKGSYAPELDERASQLAEGDVNATLEAQSAEFDPTAFFDTVFQDPTPRMLEERRQLESILMDRKISAIK